MARVVLGNHTAVFAARPKQERIRKFYGEVLGCKARVTSDEVDRFQLEDVHFCFVWQSNALDTADFLKAIYARRTNTGNYVPLLDQDVKLWSKEMMEEAEHWLREASRTKRFGRFQFEAAIQSAHAQRARTGETDWKAVAMLYEGLISRCPTIGALVGHAAAVAEAEGPERGWTLLQEISPGLVSEYQPYWAPSAHLLTRMRRSSEAAAAYSRAIGFVRTRPCRNS